MNKVEIIQQPYLVSHTFADDGIFPNSDLPLLVYKGALRLHPEENDETVKAIFNSNGWTNAWSGDIYTYHHYHSTTHEALGIVCGQADVQFGGDEGTCIELFRGDVVIIPAGVAHKCLKATKDFSCVGAYPPGGNYDILYGKDGERPAADERIKQVPLPESDPVYGKNGHLTELWQPVRG
ncbi:hypothetical protein FW774_04885 (plasmid) [Pedobacter sp. BS3]|uniref:hypothetical protein n=1 Tax=Pedobacter sp. BS3 TaxID=2567937 RepID=UPI0011EE3536|nr:hypothetical protein [Pedobacter sp. BS3]TZF86384.1 hypothetical protein FW774_04885 [Pedobacter sp. BS3]